MSGEHEAPATVPAWFPSKKTAKAVAAAVVILAAYFVGILGAGDNLGDVTFVQWLGAVLFVGSAYGITYKVPNRG